MAWVEFPFPECPDCNRSWSTSRHRKCSVGGDLDVAPDTSMVRCTGCQVIWSVWKTNFYCACGRQFESSEVKSALEEIIRVAAMLLEALRRQAEDLLEIRRSGDASFRSWLSNFTQNLAASLGGAAGRFVGSLLRSLGFDQ
ncbi:hypothetical protein ACFU53_10745 [Streptomyces sp. NPDC057474]|uniref:hypothetical protein n=1 Tax=Streptomyces sp. NPDC057474 TaxID=3346144 RepID=UPI0036A66DAC